MASPQRLLALLGGLAAGGLGATLRAPARQDTVRVDFYYETMCPYCHKFWNNSLKAVWAHPDFKPRLDLRLYPAGNVQVLETSKVSQGYLFWHEDKKSDDYIFICQHGESECLGNMIHSCAMKLLDTEKYMQLFFCMAALTNFVPEKSSYQCSQELGIEPEPIKACVRSRESQKDMLAITSKEDLLKTPRKWVPWVLINGAALEVEEEFDFMRGLCTAMSSTAPAVCATLPKKQNATNGTNATLKAVNLAQHRCHRDD